MEAADLAGRLNLAREPHPELRVVGIFGPDQLDRYLPAAPRLAEEDLPHAAAPDPAK
jgi:hypothetical protein